MPDSSLAHDTVLCNSAYIVKGAPGRILWSMLKARADSGRTRFSNRELRLDESLELPAGNDNLEAPLLVLRRRRAGINCGVTLERVGRGRLGLRRPDHPLREGAMRDDRGDRPRGRLPARGQYHAE